MADLRPFRGIRYNLSMTGDLDLVVSQPYDKITDAMREEYYAKSEHNVVRIIKGRPGANDSAEDNIYTRAKAYLDRWLGEKVLVRDESPSLYVYHQEFEVPGVGRKTRKGFICTIRLVPFSDNIVLPHEKTLSKPKEDRLNLLRQSLANFGQIFMLYPDESSSVHSLLEPFAQSQPEMEALEEGTVRHRVWTVKDEKVIAAVVEAMKEKSLFIADGHHRYETALSYLEERKAANPSHTGEEPYNYRMVTLVGMEDPGLLILPTHRLVHGLEEFDLQAFLKRSSSFFEMKDQTSLTDTLSEMAKSTRKGHAFGIYSSGKYWVLLSKNGSGWEKMLPSDRSSDWRGLDVVVLHQVLIQELLEISEERVKAQENIRYLRDPADGIRAVDAGEAQLLLLVNPTTISQVKAVASNLETMPQKSTDFFPKLITGLVINPLD